MRLENLLSGLTIPGAVPADRVENLDKQLSTDQKALFVIQNLISEIARLNKRLAKVNGLTLSSHFIDSIGAKHKTAIARAWGVGRLAFSKQLEKLQTTGLLSRKVGSGAPISVMTEAVKNKLVKILINNNGDIDFRTWEVEISKDKRFTRTPKRESIRRWWIKECGGFYVQKKSRPMISKENARSRVEFCKKYLAMEEISAQIHHDEGLAYAIRWCRKLKGIKPGMLENLPDGFKPKKKAVQSRRHTPKIMLSVTIARPEKKEGIGFYGGPVSLLRCAKDVVAKHSSKYHKRGAIYKKYCSVNRTMFKNQLTKSIFPAIKKNICLLDKSKRFCQQLKVKDPTYKLPNGSKWADLSIQFDNAPPHCTKNKRLISMIRKAGGRNVIGGSYYGPKVRISFQPPNSPDLNVLDLGFFSMFWIKIHKVLKNYDFIPTITL